MKRGYLLFIGLMYFCSLASNAQTAHGLQKIIVEKYYVSDEKDAKAAKGGYLPAGSVTYRIFVEMLPAYRFQAAYGVPGHEMKIATTTSFFNNEEYGAVTANEIPKIRLTENTVMLDSWVSVGAAAEGCYGILKADDTTKAIINADGLLQNEDAKAGVPIKKCDGFYPARLMSVVTLFGLDSALTAVFKNQNSKSKGQVFATDNGSWASFGGAIGPPPHNKVLIAQLTTNGELSFELNIQIGTPTGGVENYVARNPVEKEILFPELIYPQKDEKNKTSKPGIEN